MNNIRNSVFLIGNLGQDPEMRTTVNGKTLTRFSLATNEVYRNQQGERVTETQWHRLIAWGKLGELLNSLLSKGRSVAVRGKLTYNSYEDKEGQKRLFSEIVVQEFTLLGGPKNGTETGRDGN